MAHGSGGARQARRQPELLDIGVGLAVAVAVLAMALLQWGITDAGWTRGVTLGAALGVVAVVVVRRNRLQAAARERAEAEERLQLARELHDAVASQVSIIGIQAAAGRRVLQTDPERAGESLEHIEDAARTANADLRRMLGALRSGVETSRAPGLGDLVDLAEEYRRQGLDVRLHTSGSLEALPAPVDTVAYRIVQEALANVLAHAGPTTAAISAALGAASLRLIVENDAGSPAVAPRGSGLGLQGIRERVELLGGRMEAGPRADGGFRVDVSIPVRPS